jgi:hypothetical protein
MTSLKSNLCIVLTTQNSTQNNFTIAHTHTHTNKHNITELQPDVFFNLILQLMATNKGQSAVPSANNCQGQLQTAQSVSGPATTRSPIRSSQ